MRKELIGAASALAFMAGAAIAADNSGSSATSSQLDRPAASQSQSSSSATSSKTNLPSRASAEELLGKTVVGANGEKIGEVKDVILDGRNGQAKQLVVASGGFLGIGEKDIAIDFKQAQWQPSEDRLSIPSLSRQQVQAMTEFNYDDSMVSLNRSTDMDRSSTSATRRERELESPASPATPARPLPATP